MIFFDLLVKHSVKIKDYSLTEKNIFGRIFDLLHLSNNGISLCNIKSAVCYIDKPVLDSMNYSLWHDFRSRCYLNNLRGQSALFVYIWFFTKTIINFISKIINVFSK